MSPTGAHSTRRGGTHLPDWEAGAHQMGRSGGSRPGADRSCGAVETATTRTAWRSRRTAPDFMCWRACPALSSRYRSKPDGSAGRRRPLCDMGMSVPDGVALAEDGSFYIACYRPDAIFRWHPADGLTVFAEDPRGTVLSAPTNVVFTGTTASDSDRRSEPRAMALDEDQGERPRRSAQLSDARAAPRLNTAPEVGRSMPRGSASPAASRGHRYTEHRQ